MKNENAKRVMFLLGAGASIPAGMPSTTEITKRVLSGERVFRFNDDAYHLDGEYHSLKNYVPRVRNGLVIIKDLINDYFTKHLKRPVNYEDYYFYSQQLADTLTGEYENAAVAPALNNYLDKSSVVLNPIIPQQKQWSPTKLLSETRNYISDIVWRLLGKKYTCLDHYRFLQEAYEDDTISIAGIATLNHDTTVESFLEVHGISYTDGFGGNQKEILYWDYDLLRDDSARIRVLKLHGSINWFRFGGKLDGTQPACVGKVITRDIHHILGESRWPEPSHPLILIGTFNKILDYWGMIYADIHCAFHGGLRESKNLIVGGYGFGDKAINTRVILWMQESIDNRLVIIHDKPESLIERARPAVSRIIPNWQREGRAIIVKRRINNELNWREHLKPHLRLQ